jgi:hypothetical protein
MRLNSIGDAREQQRREPSGAPPLHVEIAFVVGTILASILVGWLQG